MYMENYTKPKSKLNGECPYCGGLSSFTDEKMYRKLKIQKHSCDKYSAFNVNTGIRYPLQESANPDSTPYI